MLMTDSQSEKILWSRGRVKQVDSTSIPLKNSSEDVTKVVEICNRFSDQQYIKYTGWPKKLAQ